VMRRLNLALAPYELPWERYAHGVKDPFATKILAGHRRDEQPIGLKAPRWLRQRAKEINDRVAALPIRVIGDVRELTPVDVPGVDPAKVSVDARFDAAVAGLAGLLAYEPEQ